MIRDAVKWTHQWYWSVLLQPNQGVRTILNCLPPRPCHYRTSNSSTFNSLGEATALSSAIRREALMLRLMLWLMLWLMRLEALTKLWMDLLAFNRRLEKVFFFIEGSKEAESIRLGAPLILQKIFCGGRWEHQESKIKPTKRSTAALYPSDALKNLTTLNQSNSPLLNPLIIWFPNSKSFFLRCRYKIKICLSTNGTNFRSFEPRLFILN